MGLIKAFTTSTSGVLGDQFKEYVTCPTMDKDVLVQRGIINHGKGNTNPSENIISNGSAIAVPDGTAMMVIENGQILEFSADLKSDSRYRTYFLVIKKSCSLSIF